MTANTSAFIAAMSATINAIANCYYEKAPDDAAYPFVVLGALRITSLDDGDLVPFDLDVWTDEKTADATVTLEALCDTLRNTLTGAIVSTANTFYAHIGFESQTPPAEPEFDLCHRRLAMSARIFYIGGN